MPISISSAGISGLQRQIGQTNNRLGQSLKQISSGKRINKGADDAAGLAISEKLKADLSSLEQASKNTSSGSAMLRTAAGGLSQIGGMLSRGRELAVQASTGTLNDSQRATIDREFQAIKQEIDRITSTTEFNGQQLLSGDLGPGAANPVAIQVGANNTASDRITIDTIEATDTGTLGVQDTSIDTAANARASLDNIDAAIAKVSDTRASVGAIENRFQTTAANIATTRENLTAAESSISDADIAQQVSEKEKNEALGQAGVSALKSKLALQQNLIGGLLNTKG